MDQTYRSYLFQNDVSSYFNYFCRRLSGKTQLSIECAMMGSVVDIPVRHRNLTKISCLFELEIWSSYIDELRTEKPGELYNGQTVTCPACRGLVSITDFGIDRQLYHALTTMKILKMTPPNYIENKLSFSSTTNKYYALRIDKSKNQLSDIEIPGQQLVKFKSSDLSIQADTREKQILSQIDLISHFYRNLNGLQLYQLNLVANMMANLTAKIDENIDQKQILNKMKLFVQGQKQLDRNNFVFSLLKQTKRDPNETYTIVEDFKFNILIQLVVYFIDYSIWHFYQLMYNKKKFLHPENGLYLKCSKII